MQIVPLNMKKKAGIPPAFSPYFARLERACFQPVLDDSLVDYASAVQALPAVKSNEVISKPLRNHQSATFWAFHNRPSLSIIIAVKSAVSSLLSPCSDTRLYRVARAMPGSIKKI
jgi:hypothetical protein